MESRLIAIKDKDLLISLERWLIMVKKLKDLLIVQMSIECAFLYHRNILITLIDSLMKMSLNHQLSLMPRLVCLFSELENNVKLLILNKELLMIKKSLLDLLHLPQLYSEVVKSLVMHTDVSKLVFLFLEDMVMMVLWLKTLLTFSELSGVLVKELLIDLSKN